MDNYVADRGMGRSKSGSRLQCISCCYHVFIEGVAIPSALGLTVDSLVVTVIVEGVVIPNC